MDQQTQLLLMLVCILGVAGIVVWHLQGRLRPTARLVVQIAFFAAMTAALAYSGINPFRFDPANLGKTQTLFMAAKTLWWVHLSWAVIGFVRLYLVLDGRPREARLIQDLVVPSSICFPSWRSSSACRLAACWRLRASSRSSSGSPCRAR
ncbi:hypothetical protein ABIE33_006060 [Ensifer sp. 4252]